MTKRIITKKQHIILLLLYTFRFVNSKQIQALLGHKDHRRTNSWLKDLTTKGYIERDFVMRYAIATKPAVYNLSSLGRKYIGDYYPYYFPAYLKKISRDKYISKAFRVKCQILVEWYVLLFPLNKKDPTLSQRGKTTYIRILDFLVRLLEKGGIDKKERNPLNKLEFFTSAYFPPFILLEKLKPDGYLCKNIKGNLAHGLLFIIDAYVARVMLRYLIQRIFDALRKENWEEDKMNSLQIYLLCPNNQVIIYLKRLITSFITRYHRETPLLFRLATRSQMTKAKMLKTKIEWVTISSIDK